MKTESYYIYEYAIRQTYESLEISSIGFVRGSHYHTSDSLSPKIKQNCINCLLQHNLSLRLNNESLEIHNDVPNIRINVPCRGNKHLLYTFFPYIVISIANTFSSYVQSLLSTMMNNSTYLSSVQRRPTHSISRKKLCIIKRRIFT